MQLGFALWSFSSVTASRSRWCDTVRDAAAAAAAALSLRGDCSRGACLAGAAPATRSARDPRPAPRLGRPTPASTGLVAICEAALSRSLPSALRASPGPGIPSFCAVQNMFFEGLNGGMSTEDAPDDTDTVESVGERGPSWCQEGAPCVCQRTGSSREQRPAGGRPAGRLAGKSTPICRQAGAPGSDAPASTGACPGSPTAPPRSRARTTSPPQFGSETTWSVRYRASAESAGSPAAHLRPASPLPTRAAGACKLTCKLSCKLC